jgi:hypothetical protein
MRESQHGRREGQPSDRYQQDPYQQPDQGAYQQPGRGGYDDYYRQPPPPGNAPGAYPPAGYAPPPPPRKKRRVFVWFFFAAQALFIIWLITGLVSTGHTAPSSADLAQLCASSGPKSVIALYHSRAQCMSSQSRILSDAAGTGRGIGVALVVMIWIVVDFFLGLFYGIYRLATRSRG